MSIAKPRKNKRPLLRSFRFWVPTVLLVLLTALGISAALLVPRGISAADALQKAAPLTASAKEHLLSGDTEGAQSVLEELSSEAFEAHLATDYWLWRAYEWLPVVGDNLAAVRLASATLNDLSTEVFPTLVGVNFDMLKPVDGAIDIASLVELTPAVDRAVEISGSALTELGDLDQGVLVEQVRGGVEQLESGLAQLNDILAPAQTVLQLLPDALGANGQKNYLLLFQNNAEMRTTGGNPAALALLTVDQGRISIGQQASSSDFNNNRPYPIFPLDPETEVIYGPRIGMFMQDATFTPDFAETSELIRAFWAESFDEPIDAVISFDPIALSYLLEATGPVNLESGEELTADNAASLLLNEVYFRFPDGKGSDEYFAAATQSIFAAVTSGQAESRAFVTALIRAAEEGRILFNSEDEAQMALLGSSPIAGPLPASNSEITVLGVFFNDLTVGKLDYYLDAAVETTTTQCAVNDGEAVRFTATTHLNNRINAALLATLPLYVTDRNYGSEGAIQTDVLVYGPVGTRIVSVEINGEVVGINGWPDGQYRELAHHGRPVLQVPMLVRMEGTADVTVVFEAGEDQTAASFAPFETRVTPMVNETPVTVSRPGCE